MQRATLQHNFPPSWVFLCEWIAAVSLFLNTRQWQGVPSHSGPSQDIQNASPSSLHTFLHVLPEELYLLLA